MSEIMPGAGLCPHCHVSLSASATMDAGRFSHHPRLGFCVDGNRLETTRSVHALLGSILRAGGALVTLDVLAQAMGYAGKDPQSIISVQCHHARNALRAQFAITQMPFERIPGHGIIWKGDGLGIEPITSIPPICPECGYDIIPETGISSGPFRYDPENAIVYVHGVKLRGSPRMHALLSTFMRSKGEVLTDDAIADRLGVEGENPNMTIKVVLSGLRAVLRYHGAELPVIRYNRTGYRWTGDLEGTVDRFSGPPAPARIRRGPITGPDMTTALLTPPAGLHSCGCPLAPPEIIAGHWKWSQLEGISFQKQPLPLRPTASLVLSRIIAASGRYVHHSDLHDLIGGDQSLRQKHYNVIICNARSDAKELDIELPLASKHRQGMCWTGPRPSLVAASPDEECPECLARAKNIMALTGSNVGPVRHPVPLTGHAKLIADILSACPGRVITIDKIMEITQTKGDPRVVAVQICRIRRCYTKGGYECPIKSVWGRGYRWDASNTSISQTFHVPSPAGAHTLPN